MPEFTKMHGLGNHFLFFFEQGNTLSHLKTHNAITTLCSPSFGLGADGIIFIREPEQTKNNCRMQIFNSDASEAEMCGNAIRGVAHLYLRKHPELNSVLVETKAGTKVITPSKPNDKLPCYRVEMGKAEFDLTKTQELIVEDKRTPFEWQGKSFSLDYANIGNPHGIYFLDAPLPHTEMAALGAWLETHPNHPRQMNIEFVETISPNEVRVTVWERGCGFTQACGTGATAVSAVGVRKGILQSPVIVHMPGGDLTIEVNTGTLFMSGPVQEVASGTLAPSLLQSL